MRFDKTTKAKAVVLRCLGFSYVAIADILSCAVATARYHTDLKHRQRRRIYASERAKKPEVKQRANDLVRVRRAENPEKVSRA
jgi:hypothetical protein